LRLSHVLPRAASLSCSESCRCIWETRIVGLPAGRQLRAAARARTRFDIARRHEEAGDVADIDLAGAGDPRPRASALNFSIAPATGSDLARLAFKAHRAALIARLPVRANEVEQTQRLAVCGKISANTKPSTPMD
jgi:hypothetical protein